jgi:polygalacturonase
MKSPLDRRAFLLGGAAASASLLAPAALADSTLRPATDARSRGAKGDGTTDDTAALQKAIAALPPGGTLFLARGKYLIHDTLDLARGTSLIGEQLGTTIVVKQLDRPAVRTASE